MEKYFRVGVLTSEHGLKGEIKVFPTTENPSRFKLLKRVFLDLSTGNKPSINEGLMECEIEGVKFFKNMVIIKLKGIDTVEDIKKYKGTDLLIDREDALPLREGEYYVSDILGCLVLSEEGEEYGVVKDVLETGANKVLLVAANEAHREWKEFCLPYIPDCVKEVNIRERRIKVFLMPGLVDGKE